MRLTLLEAAYHDIIYAIGLQVDIEMLEEGIHCTGRGAPDFKKKKRRYYEDKRRSEKYADDILNRSRVPDDEFCRHRPNNPTVDNLSSSEDEITPKRARKSANTRVNRRRSETSKTFLKVFSSATSASFTLINVACNDQKEAHVTIRSNTGNVEVIIRKSLYCDVCFPKNEGKKTVNTCVHIVWVLMRVFNISRKSLLAQVNLTENEVTSVLTSKNTGPNPSTSTSTSSASSASSTSSSANTKTGGSSFTLSEAEQLSIFESNSSFNKIQQWFADKLVVRKDASCCACGATMPAGKPYVFVKGLYIPRNQFFATSRTYYFCAIPTCLSKKPIGSNLSVPPTEVNVTSTTNLLSSDITNIQLRGINVVRI